MLQIVIHLEYSNSCNLPFLKLLKIYEEADVCCVCLLLFACFFRNCMHFFKMHKYIYSVKYVTTMLSVLAETLLSYLASNGYHYL